MTNARLPRQNDSGPRLRFRRQAPVASALLWLVLIGGGQFPLARTAAAEAVTVHRQEEISPLATPAALTTTTGITLTPAALPETPVSSETLNTPAAITTTPVPTNSATPTPTLTPVLEPSPSPSPQPPEPTPNALPLIVEPPTPIPAPLVVVAPLSPLRGPSGGLSPDGGSLLWVGAVGLLLLAGSSLMFIKRQK